MGDIEVMRKYMYVFDNCLYLLDNRLADPHPETLTLANIRHNNLSVIRFYMNHTIIR